MKGGKFRRESIQNERREFPYFFSQQFIAFQIQRQTRITSKSVYKKNTIIDTMNKNNSIPINTSPPPPPPSPTTAAAEGVAATSKICSKNSCTNTNTFYRIFHFPFSMKPYHRSQTSPIHQHSSLSLQQPTSHPHSSVHSSVHRTPSSCTQPFVSSP